MEQMKANTLSTIPLGRQGENLARQILFDVSGWESEYGPGSVELIAQRPGDETPYPVVTTRDGDSVVWSVTAADTLYPGDSGRCELRYYVGETLAKSRIWGTYVARAMDTPSETTPPEPEQGWVDQIIAVGAAAKASADAAKADADRAAALAAQAAEKAAQTAQDAETAAKAKEAAETAKRLAEDAQRAAETAKQAAEAAQSAAAQSATDAATAKQGAEAALKSAHDAAAAAAKALADIRALYQEMQTWAQGVIQDVNDAGSAAVQSVQSAGDTQVQRVTDEGTTQTANAKAQADAAAQSAAGAAKSAQEAAESAAVYDNVVADVNQLKQDLSAEQTAREEAENTLRADLTANANADAVTRRSLDALWKLNQGISYQFETDDTEAYQKTVPSGAKLASIHRIGGKTVVWNQIYKGTDGEPSAPVIKLGITVISSGYEVYLSGVMEKDVNSDVNIYFGSNLFAEAVANHKYLYRAIGGIHYGIFPFGNVLNRPAAPASYIIVTAADNGYIQHSIAPFAGKNIANGTVVDEHIHISVFDLTKMFGSGNEPTSTDDPRIAWIEQYSAVNPEYNSGELVSADVWSVVDRGLNLFDKSTAIQNKGITPIGTIGVQVNVYLSDYISCIDFTDVSINKGGGIIWYGDDGSVLGFAGGKSASIFRTYTKPSGAVKFQFDMPGQLPDDFSTVMCVAGVYTAQTIPSFTPYKKPTTYTIPAAVRSLPGYGWSAGEVCNAIERTGDGWQYVQRVGSRPYQEGDIVTDGITTYYVLDTPVVTDITDLMNGLLDAIPVEVGGTLTFENAAKLPVPSSVEYAVKLSEVNG